MLVITISGIVFILILIVLIQKKMQDVTYTFSEIDKKSYLVRNMPDKNDAADMLANIKKKLMILSDHFKNNPNIHSNCKTFLKRFNPDNIIEAPFESNSTSYSVNKGEEVALCIRSKDSSRYGKIHKINLIMYVALHEMAHVLSNSIGHNEEFRQNFIFILNEAIKLGIYKHDHYDENPQEYCGISVTENLL